MNKRFKIYQIVFSIALFQLCCSLQSAEPQRMSSSLSVVEKASGSTVKGTINGLRNGGNIYLHYDIAGVEKKVKTILKTGSFSFNVEVPHPCVAQIAFDNTGGSEISFEFVLEKGDIILTGEIERFRPAIVTGTASNNEVNAFYNEPDVRRMIDQIDQLETLQRKLELSKAKSDKIDAIGMQCLDKMDEWGNRSFRYVKEHPHSYASVFLISQHMALNSTPAEVVWVTCKNLDKELLAHSKAGMAIGNKLDELRKSGKYK